MINKGLSISKILKKEENVSLYFKSFPWEIDCSIFIKDKIYINFIIAMNLYVSYKSIKLKTEMGLL